MKLKLSIPFCFVILLSILAGPSFAPTDTSWSKPEWGFYGHRLINKLAVFCLPQDLLLFYKKNIGYITEHAVDPDKRRYASKHEAVRHYIDIDIWGTYPFFEVPRDFNKALLKYAHYTLVTNEDSLHLDLHYDENDVWFTTPDSIELYTSEIDSFRQFFKRHVFSQYYDDKWIVPSEVLDTTLNLNGTLHIEDRFSQDGILPYHLSFMKFQLTQAFTDGDIGKILRLSAEFGHYIGDAHVPLHTTVNYNGQLTDQIGIHAFWESRIPELFAEAEYNFIVGKAKYIENTNKYFWDMILDSHKLLDDVLEIEKEMSNTYPSDKQYCYDDRLDRTIRVQCPEYAAAYQDRMNGMVETRMQDAIIAISSIWYTCWVDGGQPNLSIETVDVPKEVINRDDNIQTRSHE